MDTCPACSHPAHGDGPCAGCATSNDTCWQKVTLVGGDGDRSGYGEIELASGMEARPCVHCVAFEKDTTRLQQHIVAHGLKPNAQGKFETPIAKDFRGRKSLQLDVRNFGWCRKNCQVVDMLATCENFKALRTIEQLRTRIR